MLVILNATCSSYPIDLLIGIQDHKQGFRKLQERNYTIPRNIYFIEQLMNVIVCEKNLFWICEGFIKLFKFDGACFVFIYFTNESESYIIYLLLIQVVQVHVFGL